MQRWTQEAIGAMLYQQVAQRNNLEVPAEAEPLALEATPAAEAPPLTLTAQLQRRPAYTDCPSPAPSQLQRVSNLTAQHLLLPYRGALLCSEEGCADSMPCSIGQVGLTCWVHLQKASLRRHLLLSWQRRLLMRRSLMWRPLRLCAHSLPQPASARTGQLL